MTPIKLNKKLEWAPDGIVTVNERAEVLAADTNGQHIVLVYVKPTRNTFRFVGVERVVSTPYGARREHLESGAVAKAAWLRAWQEEKQRRSYHG
jgi:hypothetical protein